MKYDYWLRSTLITPILILFSLFSVPESAYSTSPTNRAKITIYYPIPNSAITFKDGWEGINGLKIAYYRLFRESILIGSALDYSRFQIDQSKNSFLDTKNHHINPSLYIGYHYSVNKWFSLLPSINLGYTWILVRSEKFPEEAKKFDESGISFEPGISFLYQIQERVSVSIDASYKVIFEKFGEDNFGGEDSTIRYMKLGVGFLLAF